MKRRNIVAGIGEMYEGALRLGRFGEVVATVKLGRGVCVVPAMGDGVFW